MRNILLIAFLNAMIFHAAAQYENRYVDYGLIRIQGNVGLGKSLAFNANNIYWVGDLDYFLRGNISVRSGFYAFLGSYGGDEVFQHNHTAYLGVSYHFPTNNNLDPYISILPSYVVSRIDPNGIYSEVPSAYKASFNPAIGVGAGITFYANRFFNVFANVHYIKGSHFSDISAIPLDELKVSFGLGYMIWARKKHVNFRKPESALKSMR
jgi:hypothetical protein